MENEKYIGKIAADKDSNKLGKIVEVKDIQDNKTKIWKPHLLIRVKNFLRKDVIIVIDFSQVIRYDDFHVWIDITKHNFNLEVSETEH